jgi:hypothetical protein
MTGQHQQWLTQLAATCMAALAPLAAAVKRKEIGRQSQGSSLCRLVHDWMEPYACNTPCLLTGSVAFAAAAAAALRDVLEGVCILMGVKPTRKKDAQTGRIETDYWPASLKMLGDPGFMQSIM